MAISDLNLTQAKNAFSNKLEEFFSFWVEPSDSSLTDLKLDIVGTESLSMKNDITDNYVETNVSYQDQIAKKPVIYTIRGEVGEVAWYKKNEENSVIGAVESKLTPVVSFLPSTSKAVSKYQDKAMKLIGVVDSLDNYLTRILKMGESEETASKQQKAYIYLRGLREARIPINIKTPWRSLINYVVENVEFTQTGTQDKSNIVIVFKEFRETQVGAPVKFNSKKYGERLSVQKQAEDKKGFSGVTEYYRQDAKETVRSFYKGTSLGKYMK